MKMITPILQSLKVSEAKDVLDEIGVKGMNYES